MLPPRLDRPEPNPTDIASNLDRDFIPKATTRATRCQFSARFRDSTPPSPGRTREPLRGSPSARRREGVTRRSLDIPARAVKPARRHGAVFGLTIVMVMGPDKSSNDLGPNRHFWSIMDISGPEN